MIVLAMDTATPVVSAAVLGPSGVLARYRGSEDRRHGELLAPAVARLCREASTALGELDAVAVDVGPGLFTGLRVGIATARALCSALRLPGVGVTSTDALARAHSHHLGAVVAVVDARRGEVAWAEYPPGARRPVHEPALASPEGLAARLAELGASAMAGGSSGATVLVVGDGSCRYHDRLAGIPGVEVVVDGGHPDAVNVALLASERLGSGEPDSSGGLRPQYLRQADVRIGWARRQTPAGGGPCSDQ